MGTIFNPSQAVAITQGTDCIGVNRMSPHMIRDDSPGSFGDERFHCERVDVAGVGFDVTENYPDAQME
jgi:hypothetical protein